MTRRATMKWQIPSDEASRLLAKLSKTSRGIVFRRGGMIRCLVRLRALREMATIPYLLWFLHDRDAKVAREAARTLRELFDRVPNEMLPMVDERIRANYWSHSDDATPLKPDDVREFDFQEDTPVALGGISCHHNGYGREQAVRRLDREVTDGSEIRFLLLRLNDWAEPVRRAAATAIGHRLSERHRPAYLGCLPLVTRLQQRLRAGESAAFGEIKRLLQSAPGELASSALGSSDPGTRRNATAWAWEAATIGGEDLQRAVIERMLASDQPASRIRAASWVTSREFAPALQQQWMPVLLQDRLAAVRRLALGWCATADPEGQRATLRRALLDQSAIMRSMAQFHLPKMESIDLRRFYREAIERQDAKTMKAALAGLGEMGRAEDAPLVHRFVDAPLIGLRKAALAALARLAPKENLELFIRALQDNSAGVSRQARGILKAHAATIGTDRLRAIYLQASHEHVRRQSLSLVRKLPKWDAVPLLVEVHGRERGPIQLLARRFLASWLAGFNRTHQVQPTARDIAKFREVLAVHGDQLPTGIGRELRGLAEALRSPFS